MGSIPTSPGFFGKSRTSIAYERYGFNTHKNLQKINLIKQCYLSQRHKFEPQFMTETNISTFVGLNICTSNGQMRKSSKSEFS